MSLPREHISRLADSIRSACRMDATPVDVDELVRRLKGTVVDVPGADFEAMVEKADDDGFVISLGPQHYNLRRRFSVAHELGHLFLHMGYLVDAQRWAQVGVYRDAAYYRFGHSTEEYEANEFAAALLMPEAEFRERLTANRVEGGYRIDPVAAHFGVSREAAVNRGRWLGLLSWQ